MVDGSPAHAGMDPSGGRIVQLSDCGMAPRTRGDGPNEPRCAHISIGAGSPAHAGMDPLRGTSASRAHVQWLPRTRGDGPRAQQSLTPSPDGGGSPAHAGMDPCDDCGVILREIAWAPPHTRGWTLRSHRPMPDRATAPPHTRGWTPEHAAKADVARTWAPPHTRGWTLPRGEDRPGAACRAPPHTRGWTPADRSFGSTGRWDGSPAHAGMDPRHHQR